MKAVSLFLFLCVFVKHPEIDKGEAQKAFLLLNKIRTAPSAFTAEMPFLAEIEKRFILKWNDRLAAIAEAKALDRSSSNYFGYTNLGAWDGSLY